MQPMKLADVVKHTGSPMSLAVAKTLVRDDFTLRNMALALSMHTWNNTPESWLRLQAALVILSARRKRLYGR